MISLVSAIALGGTRSALMVEELMNEALVASEGGATAVRQNGF